MPSPEEGQEKALEIEVFFITFFLVEVEEKEKGKGKGKAQGQKFGSRVMAWGLGTRAGGWG
jgi:hypothetical protein